MKLFRYDADCVMKNIFEIFDSMNTGKIGQNEILWVFSMAMNGTGYISFISLFIHRMLTNDGHPFYICI